MHLENFAPLLGLWPLVLLLILGIGAFVWFESGKRRRQLKQTAARDRRYWVAELAYRARMRAMEWLSRTKTPRLTYQGPPILDEEMAEASANDIDDIEVVKRARRG